MKVCKVCFIELPKRHKQDFCLDCIDEFDADLKTQFAYDDFDDEEWFEVPSPYKAYKEGV